MDSNSSKNNNEKSPYEILGVKEGAAFEDIQEARDIKVKEAGEDLILKAKIESSFDQLLMGSLKARQSGNVSYEAVSCLLYTSPSPRDSIRSRMPSSA